MTDDPKVLVGGYATDSLTEVERQRLLRGALEDQALFDALLDEEGLRELLADPEARQHVLATLERPDRRERWRAWLRRPATVADLLTVAAALVVAVVVQQVYRGATTVEQTAPVASRPSPPSLSQATLDRLAALPPSGSGVSATLALEGRPAGTPPRLSPGERVAIRLTVAAPARVLLLEVRPSGEVTQAWPAPGEDPALLAASSSSTPAVQQVSRAASSLPGATRFRLVVAPMGLDLTALSPADLERVASRLTLVDLTYETEGP